MVRLPDGFSCLDLAVVFLRRGGVVTNCASVSSLGPAAGAREQLFPLRPLTKGQPVCENSSFPEELMMPTEIALAWTWTQPWQVSQALFIRKQPIFGHCLCFTFASWIGIPVPHSLQTLHADSTPDCKSLQRYAFFQDRGLCCTPTVLLSTFYHQRKRKSGEKTKMQACWLPDLFSCVNFHFLSLNIFFIIVIVIPCGKSRKIIQNTKRSKTETSYQSLHKM